MAHLIVNLVGPGFKSHTEKFVAVPAVGEEIGIEGQSYTVRQISWQKLNSVRIPVAFLEKIVN